MDRVWRSLRHFNFEKTVSAVLLSGGIVLACALTSRFVREELDARIAQQASYLLIAGTPLSFPLPPATNLPTVTPTLALILPTVTPPPPPTQTPTPSPAIRVVAPAIDLNTNIVESYPAPISSWLGDETMMWQPVAFAAGHPNTSGEPGGGTNIVLMGHNNIDGAVFSRLDGLQLGDDVILYTVDEEFHYQVREKIIVPYLGVETEADAKLLAYTAPTSSEILTLISCWPYTGNSHRIIVLANPLSKRNVMP